MQRQKARWLRSYSYIDAFASVGTYLDPEIAEYVDGSPFVALRCEPPFDEFWFVELSQGRLQNLRARVEAECPSCIAHFHQADANRVLQDEIARQITYESRRRGFVFLDPYGLEVDLQTVERLSKARAFDVFINFSTMGITRLLGRDELPDAQKSAILDRVMGDTAWIDALYARQPDFFGGEAVSRGPLDPLAVAGRYPHQVRKLFPHVSEAVLMSNSRNVPLYVLFLASHNQTAVRITNDIFKRFERLRVQQR